MLSTLDPLPFVEAIAFWADKIKMSPKDFLKLSEQAKAIAFSISSVTIGEELDVYYDLIGKAIEDGTTLKTFQKDLEKTFLNKGWIALPPHLLETIFRTNLQSAYNAGHYQRLIKDIDLFPYWMYSAIDDTRTRPTHAAMDNRVWPADHPMWETWFPPNGFSCRCSVIGVDADQVGKMGLNIEGDDPTGQTIPIFDDDGKQTGSTLLQPDKGFDYNPGIKDFDFDKKIEALSEPVKTAIKKL